MNDKHVEIYGVSILEGEKSLGNVGRAMSKSAAEQYVASHNRFYRSTNRSARVVRFLLPTAMGHLTPEPTLT